MMRIGSILVLALMPALGLARAAEETPATRQEIKLKSSAFNEGRAIPSKYTCDGKDVSPRLSWTGTPPGTKSLALIAEDPDAPMGTWVHWVLYNVPPTTRQLREELPAEERLRDGTIQGRNDFDRTGYGGPCPPSGIHRYFFQLFALDTALALKPGATAKQVKTAMQGHILAEAQLMGTYRKKGQ
jgi:Raf kinase inhibitor-like YbhB/YbcL family protein